MMERIVRSDIPDAEIPCISLYEFCMQDYETFKDGDCWIDATNPNKKYTFREARESAEALGRSLIARGIKKGDVIAIYSYNSIDYGVVMLACWAIGATFTTINYLYTVDEVLYQLNDASVKCLFAASDNEIFNRAKSATKEFNIPLYSMDPVSGFESFPELVTQGKSSRLCLPSQQIIDVKNDLGMLLYSSGTTGRPKGVMLTHYSCVASNSALRAILETDKYENVVKNDLAQLALNPMFHAAGLNSLLNSYSRGCKMVVVGRFQPKIFLDTIVRYQIAVLTVSPPVMVFLAKHPLVPEYDLSCLKAIVSGAAPLSKEVADLVKARLKHGVIVLQGYGMTELSPISHVLPPGTLKLGSIGKVLPNTECKVVDVDTGETLGPGRDGELWIRGPQVMKGYLNKPDATKHTIDKDGFLHTGDVGHYDEEGFFFITDRIKELIKYNAFQVAPADLEGLLLGHSAVADCAVIGVPDVQAGELPKAYVVLKPGHRVTEADLTTYVSDRVAPHKHLRGGVEFIAEIPKTESGKILRRVLKQQAARTAAKSKL